MTNESHTPVPNAGAGAKIGWIIVVVLMIIGMVVAWFTLNAGQVWVVSEKQSYSQYEETTSVNEWLPADSGRVRELVHYGAAISDTREISNIGESQSLRSEVEKDVYSDKSMASSAKAIAAGQTAKLVLVTGDITVDRWVNDNDEESSPEEGWKSTGKTSKWEVTKEVPLNRPRPENATFSVSRTIGIWLSAILTLAIMSFLFGDNALYKTAEAIVVGTSAAYWMAYSFYTGIVDQLLINLFPSMVRSFTSPGLPWDYQWNWVFIIPGILAVMLICRLLPKGGWIARWPLAFIIGATAGFRLTSHLESDFLLQIKATITSLWSVDAAGQFEFWNSVGAIVILLGVLLCLVYFFFSLEHKGAVGKAARGGIFVLMITFGAAFGLTVMGRITLLTERFDFLFKEWLHLL
ncbi:MAG: hypothetical protein CMJ40_00375 [Phycisphaerae bacterium]|nr:hypothetical protein [Phycisphaerae bacterium]